MKKIAEKLWCGDETAYKEIQELWPKWQTKIEKILIQMNQNNMQEEVAGLLNEIQELSLGLEKRDKMRIADMLGYKIATMLTEYEKKVGDIYEKYNAI